MIIKTIRCLALTLAALCACGVSVMAQTLVPSTFKHITVDGSFGDWNGVPIAYTEADGATNAIQYENIYIANDETNLYIRFTLYAPRPDAFANSYDNIFIDTDTNSATGYPVAGIGSEMLIQWGGGYQEKNGGFNEGGINGLGWNLAGSPDSTGFELSISLGATYASDGTPVFTTNTIALLLEGDNTSYASTEFAPPSGGLIYTFATPPAALATNTPLITLANSSWEVNASGTDLSTNWLAQDYDDTVAGWATGDGLFGYTPYPASYPAIQTPLASGPNTYYFRTHFPWTNDTANVAFVVTNYLTDGAIYYLNGAQVASVRMPSGAVTYATAATTTNSPVGQTDVFGVDGATLQSGDNIMEVETHQAPNSSADMVFGLSLTAAAQHPVLIVSTNLPVSQAVYAGQPVTFTSDVLGSGPLSYQWFFNGTNAITGANSSTYTIPLVLTNNIGAYSLQVSNSSSSATTPAASLIVSNIAVNITAQPASAVAMAGQPATFGVTVTGTPLIQYQWFFDDAAIAGATNATYTIASCALTNAGTYQVTVSNPALTTNSSVVNLTVVPNNLPPNIIALSGSAGQITITFSGPVDPVTAGMVNNYSVSNNVTVSSAALNPANAAQVILTTEAPLNFGTVYTVTINGVKDVYGNVAHVSGQFARDIAIDGSFDDWTGLAPIYSTSAPSGNTNAADFEDIYMYDDTNYYYFRVTLWTDVNPSSGYVFPAYVSMFFDTDNNASTGYGTIGSELMVQSGDAYQEKNGGYNEGETLVGLNWLSLPASPGTNFEFRMCKAATFSDGTPVFTTNILNFLWEAANTSFVVQNIVPAGGGEVSYTNVPPVSVAALPLGSLALFNLKIGQAAVVWNPPGTLQVSSMLKGSAWTSLPSATSPYIIPITSTNQFFRLSQ